VLGALTELATTSVDQLQGKRLEAEDFDKLFSADSAKDVLLWLSDPEGIKSEWRGGRWSAFRSRCKAELNLDPDKDGALVAAELLGKRAGAWEAVWERFSESPGLYLGMPALLAKAKPMELLLEPSSWPQDNEKAEATLRRGAVDDGSSDAR
jgi:hypothetical protein